MNRVPVVLALCSLMAIGMLAGPPAAAMRTTEGPLLPRPGLLRALFSAQLPLVTDYFWLLTINKVGSAGTPEEFRDIYYYADLVTDLDPRFRKVYSFAGVAIPVQTGRDQYANAEESTRLLRKGVQHVPDDFRSQFQLAYNLIFFHHQHREAADRLMKLQEHPDAPPWLGKLATRLYAQAGDFDMSYAITQQLMESAEDEDTRAQYELRLKEIAQEQVLRVIDAAAAAYASRSGSPPPSVEALIGSGDLQQIPVDPLEGTFFLGKDGRARSTASKYRLEVITESLKEQESKLRPEPAPTP